jgi:general secretion pathway protein D
LKSVFNVLASGYTGNQGALSIGTLASDDYTVLIEALDTVGKTNVLSNPRIAVVNNEEAKILVGSSQPYVTTQTTTPGSGPSTTAETVNFIEVGVKLFVTPTIHGDGYITMKIRPEVSSAANTLPTSSGNKIPIVETSQAETTVMAKDNATIVIGGLIKEQNSKTINKIPFLGDLPFVGLAFRNESKTKKKTEIVIFLTPKIITGDHILEPSPPKDKE